MPAVYSVQIVDRRTGVERAIRVEAESKDAAIEQVVALGEMVGGCDLVEVVAERDARAKLTEATIPGLVVCPRCSGMEWRGSRGVLFWLLVILFFPLGLLLLFLQQTWKCRQCRYSFRSSTAPASLMAGRSIAAQIARGLAIAVLGTAMFVLIMVVAASL